jgi:peptidoglycan/LPS O-acetylase OafA/YrhL
MGRHSYELYLFHIVVLAAMRDLTKAVGMVLTTKCLWLLIFLLLSVAFSGAIARLHSEPLNKKLRGALFGSSKLASPN